jgi:mannose/fructose/N-acetylgalactosamine-specific phosphotransferase system component IID
LTVSQGQKFILCTRFSNSSVLGVFLLINHKRKEKTMGKSIFESIKDGVIGTISGTGDVASAVVDTVSGTLTHTINGTSAVGTSLIEAVSDVGRAAIRGASGVGGDVGAAAKGAVIRCPARD